MLSTTSKWANARSGTASRSAGRRRLARRSGDVPELLLLHRNGEGPDYERDCDRGLPSGARYPGENIAASVVRELLEETGLAVPIVSVETDNPEWLTYLADKWGT